MEAIKNAVAHVAYAIPKFDPRAGRILVTDGNGVIGHRVAAKLLDSGIPNICVGCADAELPEVARLVSKGAEVREFVWEKEYAYEQALKGMHSVYVAFPGVEGMEEKYPKFIAACKKMGVKHVVQLSFYHAMKEESVGMINFATRKHTADPFASIPLIKIHGWCDERLVKSGLNYAILFASHLMSNPLRYQSDQIRRENKFYGASGGKGVNYVSPNDVAEVAVRALLAPKDHYHIGYTLTGATTITDAQVAELISAQEKERITFDEHLPTEGVDPSFMMLEQVKASGAEDDIGFVSKDFVKVCGHEQESYLDYLENKEAMSPKELVAFLPCTVV